MLFTLKSTAEGIWYPSTGLNYPISANENIGYVVPTDWNSGPKYKDYSFTVTMTDGVYPVDGTFIIRTNRNLGPTWVTNSGVVINSPSFDINNSNAQVNLDYQLVANDPENIPTTIYMTIEGSPTILELNSETLITLTGDGRVYGILPPVDRDEHYDFYAIAWDNTNAYGDQGGNWRYYTNLQHFRIWNRFDKSPVWVSSPIINHNEGQHIAFYPQAAQSGDWANCTFTFISGNLPPSLTFTSGSGIISGKLDFLPDGINKTSYTFTLRAHNSSYNKRTVDQTFTFNVYRDYAPTWITPEAPAIGISHVANVAFEINVVAQNNSGPYGEPLVYSITDRGTLPNTINGVTSDGGLTIYGTLPFTLDPHVSENYNFSANVYDGSRTTNGTFILQTLANQPPIWQNPTSDVGAFAHIYANTNASNNIIFISAIDPEANAVTYSLSSSSTLPNGMIFHENGVITGVTPAVDPPTYYTRYTFDAIANDGTISNTASFALDVRRNVEPEWVTNSGQILRIAAGVHPSNRVVATDYWDDPLSYSITGGSLPDGITFQNSGTFGGTAPVLTNSTTYSFEVSVTDGLFTEKRDFSILVQAYEPPVLVPNNISYNINAAANTGTILANISQIDYFTASLYAYSPVLLEDADPGTSPINFGINNTDKKITFKSIGSPDIDVSNNVHYDFIGGNISAHVPVIDNTNTNYSFTYTANDGISETTGTYIVEISYEAPVLVPPSGTIFSSKDDFNKQIYAYSAPLYANANVGDSQINYGITYTEIGNSLTSPSDHANDALYKALSYDPTTGNATATIPVINASSQYAFKFKASDGVGESVGTYYINLLYQPPIIVPNSSVTVKQFEKTVFTTQVYGYSSYYQDDLHNGIVTADGIYNYKIVKTDFLDIAGPTNAITFANSVNDLSYEMNSGILSATLPSVTSDTLLGFQFVANDGISQSSRNFYVDVIYNSPPNFVTPSSLPFTYEQTYYSTEIVAYSNSSIESPTVYYSMGNNTVLPSPLSLSANGVISGYGPVVNVDTNYNFTITATSGTKHSNKNFNLLVKKNRPPVWATNASLPDAVGGGNVTYLLKADDPNGYNLTFSFISGTLPPNLIFNSNVTANSCSLSGDAAFVLQDTNYTFTIGADNGFIRSDRVFTLTIRYNTRNDPNSNSVSLLMHFEDLTDFMGHTVTSHGNLSLINPIKNQNNAPRMLTTTNSQLLDHSTQKYGNSSLIISDTSSYLTVSKDKNLDLLNNGEYTAEAWVYSTSTVSNSFVLSMGILSSGDYNWSISSSNSKWAFNTSNNQSYNMGNIQANTWTHLAVTRHLGTYYLFNNGTLQNQFSDSTLYNSNAQLAIGGYAGDANFANVAVLCHFDNNLNDLSNYGVTFSAFNGATTSSNKKFGSGSLQLTGGTQYLKSSVSSHFNIGAKDYTIEFWLYTTSLGGTIISCVSDPSNYPSYWTIAINNNGSLGITTFDPFANIYLGVYASSAGAININQWQHVAISFTSNGPYGTALSIARFFVNGIGFGTANIQSVFGSFPSYLQVGFHFVGTAITGYLDDLRLTEGVARYTSNFTPPSIPFPSSSLTSTYYIDDLRITGAARYTSNFVPLTSSFPNPPLWTTANNTTFYGDNGTNISASVLATSNDSTSNAITHYTIKNSSSITIDSNGNITGHFTSDKQTVDIIAQDQNYNNTKDLFVNFIPIVPYFSVTSPSSTALIMNMSSSSTLLQDSSQNNFTIVNGSSATWSSQSPFSSGGSAVFDGSSYMNVPKNSEFAFGTGDFTIEAWVNPINAGNNNGIVQISGNPGGLYNSQSNTIALYFAGGHWGIYYNGTYIYTSVTSVANRWTHLALVRKAGKITLYVNGVADHSTTNLSDTTNYTGTYAAIGGYYSTSYLLTGSLTNVRIVKGTAVYTSNFTPSTSPLTAIANTELLLDFTSNADLSVNWSSLSPPGLGGSAAFNKSNYLMVPTSFNASIRGNDCTFEFYFYLNSLDDWDVGLASFGAGKTIFYVYGAASAAVRTPGQIGIGIGGVSEVISSAPNIVTTGRWYHVAFVSKNLTTIIYLNGVNVASGANQWNIDADSPIYIGGIMGGSLDGYITGVRLTNGQAVYTSNFTPPTGPFTAIANTTIYDITNISNGIIMNAAGEWIVKALITTNIGIKAWGAGGGQGQGGGGGYAGGNWNNISSGTVLKVWVGGGGMSAIQGHGYLGGFGNGGLCGVSNGSGEPIGSGGGLSGIFLKTASFANSILIAGGGGGGAGVQGGQGGGTNGGIGDYYGSGSYGGGGSQSSGGLFVDSGAYANGGSPGGQLMGGKGAASIYNNFSGGGGGGGYYGGGGGGGNNHHGGSGGGGSGYYNPSYISAPSLQGGDRTGAVPNNTDAMYINNAGTASTSNDPGSPAANGLVVIYLS